jgi:hypothetical protein
MIAVSAVLGGFTAIKRAWYLAFMPALQRTATRAGV